MMHSPYELNPEYILLRKELLNALHNAIESLTRREKVWIDRRYGFEDGEPHHLTEMAREYQMTKNWAKNTENRALQKLKGQMKDYDRSCLH